MPPTRRKRGRRESLTRITRSRTNARDPRGIPDVVTSPSTVSAMGPPPPQCLESGDFADDPGLRAVVSGTRTTWERNMELRMCASEKVVGEIHAMLVEMRPAPVVSSALGSAAQLVDMRPAPAVSSAPAALGSAAQAFDEVAAGRSAPQPTEIPWPTVDTFMPGTTEGMGSLPETAQNLMMAGSSYSLPLDAQIPESLRSKIWAGDFVDLSLLVKAHPGPAPRVHPICQQWGHSAHILRVSGQAQGRTIVLRALGASISAVHVGIFVGSG